MVVKKGKSNISVVSVDTTILDFDNDNLNESQQMQEIRNQMNIEQQSKQNESEITLDDNQMILEPINEKAKPKTRAKAKAKSNDKEIIEEFKLEQPLEQLIEKPVEDKPKKHELKQSLNQIIKN